MRLAYTCSRLWRYLGVYFLKPFDALNDTLTATILSTLEWSNEVIEIGAGDGTFSYIMHGGRFPVWFDRYLQTDLNRRDIFDTHTLGLFPVTTPPQRPRISISLDSKRSHIEKVSELGFARSAVLSLYESLPLSDSQVPNIFFYIPHGVQDYQVAIQEAHRVLESNGTMLILAYDQTFRSSFLCYRIGQATSGRLREYFLRLDNGRHDELMQMARLRHEWKSFFEESGFVIESQVRGLSVMAWKLYDIQTRPLLRLLIGFFNFLPRYPRLFLKLAWMITWYPVLLVLYFLLSSIDPRGRRRTCYLAFRLRKL